MIITVAAIKGGVGKTTMAMALAETLSRARPGNPTLLLDLDPQGSATGFAERTEGLLTRVQPIVGRSAGQLSRLIRDASAGEDVVVIDTPPGHIHIADAAIGEADLVLIPTEPYLDPLTQALATVEMAEGVAPTAILLNMVNTSANDSKAAREVLTGADTRVLDVEIPNWVAIARIDGSQWTTDQKILTIFSALAENVLAEVS